MRFKAHQGVSISFGAFYGVSEQGFQTSFRRVSWHFRAFQWDSEGFSRFLVALQAFNPSKGFQEVLNFFSLCFKSFLESSKSF